MKVANSECRHHNPLKNTAVKEVKDVLGEIDTSRDSITAQCPPSRCCAPTGCGRVGVRVAPGVVAGLLRPGLTVPLPLRGSFGRKAIMQGGICGGSPSPYIGFIIFSINAISSSVRLYFLYSCASISGTLLLQSISLDGVKSWRGTKE